MAHYHILMTTTIQMLKSIVEKKRYCRKKYEQRTMCGNLKYKLVDSLRFITTDLESYAQFQINISLCGARPTTTQFLLSTSACLCPQQNSYFTGCKTKGLGCELSFPVSHRQQKIKDTDQFHFYYFLPLSLLRPTAFHHNNLVGLGSTQIMMSLN